MHFGEYKFSVCVLWLYCSVLPLDCKTTSQSSGVARIKKKKKVKVSQQEIFRKHRW